jgi:hypothetical protein
MSKDGYLPDDVNEKDLPGFDDQHYLTCPMHEDAPEVYSECGGEGKCACYPDTPLGFIKRWLGQWYGPDCGIMVPRCECDDISDELAADYEDDLYNLDDDLIPGEEEFYH